MKTLPAITTNELRRAEERMIDSTMATLRYLRAREALRAQHRAASASKDREEVLRITTEYAALEAPLVDFAKSAEAAMHDFQALATQGGQR